jgi:sodium transport system permease protein
MSTRNIGIVYRKELLEALRDRRTLISTILVPILLFPILTVGVGFVVAGLIDEADREPARIVILGGSDSPAIVSSLVKSKNLIVVPEPANYVDLISNKKIRAAVEIPPGLQSGAGTDYSPVKIYMYSGDLKSTTAAKRIEEFFNDYRDNQARDRLKANKMWSQKKRSREKPSAELFLT